MASFDLLERLREGYRPPVEMLEHEPPRELVASEDILRTDALGRQVVVVPVGTVPPHWLTLTRDERASLIEPSPKKPEGWLNPGHCGFTPEGVRVGFTVEEPDW